MLIIYISNSDSKSCKYIIKYIITNLHYASSYEHYMLLFSAAITPTIIAAYSYTSNFIVVCFDVLNPIIFQGIFFRTLSF